MESIGEIAVAAAKAGLDFVVMADHHSLDARETGEEGWHGKVLMVIGTELTTDTGHLLTLNLPKAALPKASGDALDVMRQIQDAGGYAFIALPCDLKGCWKDFDRKIPGIGLEVFNLSSIARTKINIISFLLALARYRGADPVKAFNMVAARPTREIKLWDQLQDDAGRAGEPVVVGIGSVDAHATMRIAGQSFPYPKYVEVFGSLRTHVLSNTALSVGACEPAADLQIVHDCLRNGRSYTSYDNYGDPKGFTMDVIQDEQHVGEMGDTVTSHNLTEQHTFLFVRSPHAKSIIRLFKNGAPVISVASNVLVYPVTSFGIYRVEVYRFKVRIGCICFGSQPWIFGNPVRIVARGRSNGMPETANDAVQTDAT
jgi:hypothetical protein